MLIRFALQYAGHESLLQTPNFRSVVASERISPLAYLFYSTVSGRNVKVVCSRLAIYLVHFLPVAGVFDTNG